MINLLQARMQGEPERLTQVSLVKEWAVASLALNDETTLTVTELQCNEPGCPPVETVIALLSGPMKGKQFKIHRPLMELNEADVRSLAAGCDCST